MVVNRIRGECSVNLGGREHRLCYDWDALTKIDESFPDGLDLTRPEVLSQVVAIGIGDPEITPEMVSEYSPPLLPTIEAVEKAHNLAYFGQLEADDTERPPKARKAESKTFIRRLFGRAFHRSNSGG